MMNNLIKKQLLLLSYVLFFTPAVFSVEFGYGIFSSVNRSDNLNQGVDSVSGTAYDIGVRFDLGNEANANMVYQVDGLVAAADYSSDQVQREYFRALNGLFQYNAVASNFGILAVEQLTQVPANRFATEETNNLRDVNIFAIQPSYYFRLSGSNIINAYATYIDFSTGENDINSIDNSRTKNKLSIDYLNQMNETTSFAFAYEQSNTNFSSVFDPIANTGDDYSQDDYFLRWQTQGVTTNVLVNMGRSKILLDSGEKFDADLLEAQLVRVLNRTQTISLGFKNGFDSLLNFNLDSNQIDVNSQSVNFSTALKSKEKSLSYNYSDLDFSASARFYQVDLQSLQVINSEKRKGLDLSLLYSLSRVLKNPLESNIQFNYSYSKNGFNTPEVNELENTVESYTIRFNYSFTRKLDIYARLEVRESDSLSIVNTQRQTRSNNIVIGFNYTPLKRRSI